MIRPFRGAIPKVAASSYIDPSAQVIGQVEIGDESSVWPNVTIRGDVHYIRVGARTNIQDNSVLHVDGPDFPMNIGDRVTIGHSVTLHGCTIEDEALIGIGAVVLNGARIGAGAVVAAGALVPEGAQIPAGALAMGVPARVRRELTADEKARFRENCDHYIELAQAYRAEPA
ncbi:MAG: gamma carbonic anhydrase family protein [Acidobacteria bacterium]|nr:gamma carbonic anhydrase family protein [Acidobacteriota bacterium]